jgi:hypothetical protein
VIPDSPCDLERISLHHAQSQRLVFKYGYCRGIADLTADTLVEDLDHLLDLVARMTDYDEPQVLEVLECLDKLNYKKQSKSNPKAPIAAGPWNRPDCQKRRRLELKGLSSVRIANELGRQRYYKADRALYRCSHCTCVCLTWRTAVAHWQQSSHTGPVAMSCMSCGHQLPDSKVDKHETICGWDIIDVDTNQPGRLWLYFLEYLLSLKRQEIYSLIKTCRLHDPPCRHDTRGKLYP